MKVGTCIITPTWNQAAHTIRCFASVSKNTPGDYRIVWIDNGSHQDEKERVVDLMKQKRIPYDLIENSENLGFVKGTNQGIKKALEYEPEYVVFLNNDTEVYGGWLERMITTAESDKKIGIVGPLASPSHGWQDINNLRKSRKEEFFDLPKYNNDPESYSNIIREKYVGQKVQVYPNVAFFCTLIKREVIESVGLLSEDYGLGLGDDDDYCSRALDAGFKIFLAKDVFIFHNHRTTFKANFSEQEAEEMKRKNVEILKSKHQRYQIMLGGKPKNLKSFFEFSSNKIKRDGLISLVKIIFKYIFYKIKYGKISFIK